jgi:hypothetical protein
VRTLYNVGDEVSLEYAFFDPLTDEAIDPTTVELRVTDPLGESTSYIYGTDPLDRLGLGQYRKTFEAVLPGHWVFAWIAGGNIVERTVDYFEVVFDPLTEMVRSVRDEFDDLPEHVFVQDDPLEIATETIQLEAGGAALFPDPRTWIEFDDASGERALTTAAGDQDADTISVRRGLDGTNPSDHLLNTPILISPHLSRRKILRALKLVVETELWPHVWVLGEASLDYQASTAYFAAPVEGITEIVYATQTQNGRRRSVAVEFVPPELVDGATFPYGALHFGRLLSAPIHIAYRAVPTLGNLTASLRNLAVLGAVANIQQQEESRAAMPNRPGVEGQTEAAVRLRAGILARQRFEAARAQEMVSLQTLEAQRRRHVSRGV